jgi:hypothetical protein
MLQQELVRGRDKSCISHILETLGVTKDTVHRYTFPQSVFRLRNRISKDQRAQTISIVQVQSVEKALRGARGFPKASVKHNSGNNAKTRLIGARGFVYN